MVSDLLRHFQLTAVLQIRCDASRAEGMIANPGFDAGGFRTPADDAVGVLLEEGIGGKLAGLVARIVGNKLSGIRTERSLVKSCSDWRGRN